MTYGKGMFAGVQVFRALHGMPGQEPDPERVFISSPLFALLRQENASELSFDGEEITFAGIPATVYEAAEPEYYLAEKRGTFWEF